MEVSDAFRARVSTRDFSAKPLPADAVSAILDAAMYAPVGMHRYETLHLSVITSPAVLARIRQCVAKASGDPGADPLHGAPLLIVVSTSQAGEIGALNVSCLIENMLLAATDLGLGSLYVCGIVNALRDKPEFRQLLQLPEGFAPVGAAAIGYAKDGAPSRRPIPNKISQVKYI